MQDCKMCLSLSARFVVLMVCSGGLATTALSSPASNSCTAWVDECTGVHHCSTRKGNSSGNCTVTIPPNLTPAPGDCLLVNGSCQFVDECAISPWHTGCYGDGYSCTPKSEYHNISCGCGTDGLPPPKGTCQPIDGKCQWYNPCVKWAWYCGGPYLCLTDVEYYRIPKTPIPPCPLPPDRRPPGECIYQRGHCIWSSKYKYITLMHTHFYIHCIRPTNCISSSATVAIEAYTCKT